MTSVNWLHGWGSWAKRPRVVDVLSQQSLMGLRMLRPCAHVVAKIGATVSQMAAARVGACALWRRRQGHIALPTVSIRVLLAKSTEAVDQSSYRTTTTTASSVRSIAVTKTPF